MAGSSKRRKPVSAFLQRSAKAGTDDGYPTTARDSIRPPDQPIPDPCCGITIGWVAQSPRELSGKLNMALECVDPSSSTRHAASGRVSRQGADPGIEQPRKQIARPTPATFLGQIGGYRRRHAVPDETFPAGFPKVIHHSAASPAFRPHYESLCAIEPRTPEKRSLRRCRYESFEG